MKWIAIFLMSALLVLVPEVESDSVDLGQPQSSPESAASDDMYIVGPLYGDGPEDEAMAKRSGRGTSRPSFWRLLKLYRFHPGATFGWCHWPVDMRPASCFKNGIRPGTVAVTM